MKDINIIKNDRRIRRKRRIRSRVSGNVDIPRISIFKSSRYIWAQMIDDGKGETILSESSKNIKTEKGTKKTEAARMTGAELAKKSLEKGIKKAVFDRSGYKYHGRVKAFADGAREGGLKF